jgi:hypothetical protein
MYMVGTPLNITGEFSLTASMTSPGSNLGKEDLIEALADAEEHHAGKAEDVEHRQDAHDLLVVRVRAGVVYEHVERLLHVGDQIAVGQHRALGDPRRAARVLQRRHVLGRIYGYLWRGVGVGGQEVCE